ncbi:helix-turn-helix domain-containing protein [Undibacterium cyanobacteriorum]|uniref:Helix-turn-helix domain-containing protein n=1 Tax=Undibacterium cyanobacteriorum TaxID=3073561 RepID=A0ABY9RHP5_9BURK|nr:helix-turn-helix domain-containing protein [Undibacterium sp. 20NA77.5]WMW80752.1 helix-turn-helix domain-containing protein [Undibacterium sp. 20NA77.5]
MDAKTSELQLAAVAAAIAEPARASMLCALLDQRARTATELATLADISASTASSHLAKLREQNLISMVAQGKHRYFQLQGPEVAQVLEALMNLAAPARPRFKPNTPSRLQRARTCYDHMAGEIAVRMHDYFLQQGYFETNQDDVNLYHLSEAGRVFFENLGVTCSIDNHLSAQPTKNKSRRRFACACLDWSERRPHLGGAFGAQLLQFLIQQAWVERELDSRALSITRKGERQFAKWLGEA